MKRKTTREERAQLLEEHRRMATSMKLLPRPSSSGSSSTSTNNTTSTNINNNAHTSPSLSLPSSTSSSLLSSSIPSSSAAASVVVVNCCHPSMHATSSSSCPSTTPYASSTYIPNGHDKDANSVGVSSSLVHNNLGVLDASSPSSGLTSSNRGRTERTHSTSSMTNLMNDLLSFASPGSSNTIPLSGPPGSCVSNPNIPHSSSMMMTNHGIHQRDFSQRTAIPGNSSKQGNLPLLNTPCNNFAPYSLFPFLSNGCSNHDDLHQSNMALVSLLQTTTSSSSPSSSMMMMNPQLQQPQLPPCINPSLGNSNATTTTLSQLLFQLLSQHHHQQQHPFQTVNGVQIPQQLSSPPQQVQNQSSLPVEPLNTSLLSLLLENSEMNPSSSTTLANGSSSQMHLVPSFKKIHHLLLSPTQNETNLNKNSTHQDVE